MLFLFSLVRYLAEVVNGPDDNYWIVNQLIDRHSKRRQDLVEANNLGEPHFEDQWWIGAKSYVSIISFRI